MSHRSEKLQDEIAHLAGRFLARESNRTSLITITRAELNTKKTVATISVSVFPEEKSDEALAFLKRQRSNLRVFMEEKGRLSTIPRFDFILDLGEKNRQRIEQISAKMK